MAERVKPAVGERTWSRLRKLDLRRERRRRRQAYEKRIVDKAMRRVLRDQRVRSAQTLAKLSRGSGLTQSQRRVLDEIDAFLVTRPRARIALLTGTESAALSSPITTRFPSVTITEVSAEADESDRHVRLAAAGPYHLILATGERASPAELLTNVLFHLRRGGLLAVADLRLDQPSPNGLYPLITRLRVMRSRHETGEEEQVSADQKRLARAVRRVVVGDDYVIVENRTACLAKMREAEMPLLLKESRRPIGEVLVHLAPETFVPRSVIRDHRDVSVQRVQAELVVPALELREYEKVVCAPGQLVTAHNVILAETYRHHLRPRLRSRQVVDVAPRFGTLRLDISTPEHAEGAYFHWDSEFPGHFGHTLSEQVSRLWGLQMARAKHPELKILAGRRTEERDVMPFEKTILTAIGVREEDIYVCDRPVLVDHLLAATPMLSMPEYVSPDIATTWDTVGDAIVAAAGGQQFPRRFFCSRRTPKRACRNTSEVEGLFVTAGFEIVFPEELTLADQIAMFRGADIVAGYAGSALFTLMFCASPKQVIIVAPESYTATNEYLIGAVRGHSFDVFWSRPDSGAFRSTFSFDLQREGRILDQHLRTIG